MENTTLKKHRSRACPAGEQDDTAHDAFTRLLQRLKPNAETLWQEVQTQIDFKSGILVLDDSTLEKPYSNFNALVLSALVGKVKSGRLRYQPDYLALD